MKTTIYKTNIEKTETLKKAVKNLRAAQDDLRIKRAEYNQALNDLIEMKP